MVVGVAFLLGALIMCTQAHRPLRRLVGGNRDPRVVIACWLFALAGVVLTSTAAVYLLSHIGHGGFETLLTELGRCWVTVEHADVPLAERIATVTGAALLLYLGSRLTLSAVRQIRVRRKCGDTVRFLLSVIGEPGDDNIRWIDHPDPVAFSVAGRPGAHHVADALRALATTTPPGGGLAMADTAVTRRLADTTPRATPRPPQPLVRRRRPHHPGDPRRAGRRAPAQRRMRMNSPSAFHVPPAPSQ